MNPRIPRTPFSTSLSGSAKETELRLKNIFSGPKKRPPIPVMVVVALMILLCGNLVSFRMADKPLSDLPASSPTRSDLSLSPSALSGLSLLERSLQPWTPVELHSFITLSVAHFPYEYLTEAEAARLNNLPAKELPREAVDLFNAKREDFWSDLLLPVAWDEAADVTVYFVVGGMPARTSYGVALTLWGAPNLRADGIVLRWGDRTAYFPLTWYTNAKYSANPPLLVDDLDGDGLPEAALSLAWGDGTGCYEECLYLFDLDTMTYTTPEYDIPLNLTLSPDGTTASLQSGTLRTQVDITELGDRFFGRVDVGNQVRFHIADGQMLCTLDLDFTCDTLGYLARASFPVVYEDGAYRLGRAETLTDRLI